MFLKNWKMLLVATLLGSVLVGCSSYDLLDVNTVDKSVTIPIVNRPSPVVTGEVKFYVVTPENKEEFEKNFLKDNPDLVYYVLSIKSFENLANNFSEAIRYIEQMNALIEYYEGSITENGIAGNTETPPR